MAVPNGGEWLQVFKEGIGLVLGRWSSLQYAIEQGLCDYDSHLEAQNLASNILSWFIQSKDLDAYDLETLLDKAMHSFKLVHQEGSVEEVAKVLMKMYEECLVGNFKSVERLREASRNQVAHPSVGKVVNGDEDDEDSEDDNSANMDVDNSKSESNMNSVNRPVNGSKPEHNSDENIIESDNAAIMDVDNSKSESNMNSANKPVNGSQPEVAGKADDGWFVVSHKKKQG